MACIRTGRLGREVDTHATAVGIGETSPSEFAARSPACRGSPDRAPGPPEGHGVRQGTMARPWPDGFRMLAVRDYLAGQGTDALLGR